MKLKVVKQFKDKNDHKTIYQVGDVIDIKGGERIANLIKRDLCVPIDEEVEQPATGEGDPANEPKEAAPETSAKGEKSKGKTKKAKEEQPNEETPAEVETVTEQPATGEADPAGSESTEEKEA